MSIISFKAVAALGSLVAALATVPVLAQENGPLPAAAMAEQVASENQRQPARKVVGLVLTRE